MHKCITVKLFDKIKLTLELDKSIDKIAAVFDHIKAIDQLVVVIKALVVQLLNVEVTKFAFVSVHPSFDEESLWQVVKSQRTVNSW